VPVVLIAEPDQPEEAPPKIAGKMGPLIREAQAFVRRGGPRLPAVQRRLFP